MIAIEAVGLELDALVSRWTTFDEISAGYDALRSGSGVRSATRMDGVG